MIPTILSTKTIGGKESFSVRPKGQVWATPDNRIVRDGDPDAAVMISNGQDTLMFHEIEKFSNYRDFFEPVNSDDSFPAHDAVHEEASEVTATHSRKSETIPVNGKAKAK